MNGESKFVCVLNGVGKSYEQGSEVLSDISFSVPAGELVAVVGVSGSGKTTLLNILGLLDRPSTGSYRLDGDEVGRLNSDQRAVVRQKKVAFVFQAFHLLPHLTVLDNICLPLLYRNFSWKYARELAKETMAGIGLEKLEFRYPKELSAGQQQRVGVARALVCAPRLLLADEPTGNLDRALADSVFHLLDVSRRNNNFALIIVTHDKNLAAQCDRTVHIEAGKIIQNEEGK